MSDNIIDVSLSDFVAQSTAELEKITGENDVEGLIDLSSPTGIKVVIDLMNATSEIEGAANTESAFIVDAASIRALEDYVRTSAQLPSTILIMRGTYGFDALEASGALGANNGKDKGISADEMFALFTLVVKTSSRWLPIKTEILERAADLTTYYTSVAAKTKLIKTAIESLIGTVAAGDDRFYEIKLKDIAVNELKKITINIKPEILNNGSKKASNLSGVFDLLRKETESYSVSALGLYQKLNDFGKEIEKCRLSIVGKEAAIKLVLENKDRGSLSEEISTLQGQVDDAQKEYDKFVGLAFTGIAGGPIGLLVTGTYFGIKAENARARRNSLQKDLDEKRLTLYQYNLLFSTYGKLAGNLGNLQIVVSKAAKGSQVLASAWNNVGQHLVAAKDAAKNIKDSQLMIEFYSDLCVFIDSWAYASSTCTKMQQQINNVLVEMAIENSTSSNERSARDMQPVAMMSYSMSEPLTTTHSIISSPLAAICAPDAHEIVACILKDLPTVNEERDKVSTN